MKRRAFLRTASLAAGAVALSGYALAGAGDPPAARWALMGDTHIKQQDDSATPPQNHHFYNPHGNLKKAVEQIQARPWEGVAIAGDLARLTGAATDYEQLKALLAPLEGRAPVLKALGNHDDRGNFTKAFPQAAGEGQTVKGKHVELLTTPPVRVIVLDSLLYVNKVAGCLGKSQRMWLDRYLRDGAATPTVLVFHHPPNDSDDDAMLDWESLLSVAARHRAVKALVFGHSHSFSVKKHDDLHLINLPAVGYSFSAKQPVGWVEAALTAQGGDFTLRVLDGPRENDGKKQSLKWRS